MSLYILGELRDGNTFQVSRVCNSVASCAAKVERDMHVLDLCTMLAPVPIASVSIMIPATSEGLPFSPR